jgi:hypothetical protein
MSILSKIMAMVGDPLKGIIKKLGGGAPVDAPGGFRMPNTNDGSMNPMARSYFAKRAAARRTPEQRAAIAKKASESRTPEERSASAKQAAANRTPEDRVAIAKKAAETRSANQRAAARDQKAGLKREKADAKAKAKLEEKYGSENDADGDSTKTADEAYQERVEERKKKIHDVIVPHDAKEKVFYNKARRDLIISFEEAGVRWVEDQAVIEAEARTQRETHYVERNSLLRHEREELNRDNPDLSNPTNYRR